MELQKEENHLVEELTLLEHEFGELESFAFEDALLDPVTVERVQKRKEWVKTRLDTIRAELYPEVVA